MGYKEYIPHKALQPYIDAYWTMCYNGNEPLHAKVLPDGCVDIIFNFGKDYITEQGAVIMKHEHVYLVGTMTRYKPGIAMPGSLLAGIRFRPGAYSLFFGYDALYEVTDATVEPEQLLRPAIYTAEGFAEQADAILLARIPDRPSLLFPILNDIEHRKGQICVDELQKKYFVTARKLERSFKNQVGISPKSFINFVRCRNAYNDIKDNRNASIADIAYANGYYDHAHLLKAIKQFAGLPPSML